MTATNHALTGALIGLTVGNPWVAVPVAFMSHFVCDAIPHYGNGNVPVWGKPFRIMLLLDALLCVGLVGTLAYSHPSHWLLASMCAFLATSPDFLWIRRFIYARKHKRNLTKFNRLEILLGDKGIQWFQRPIGALVEVAWTVGGVVLLTAYLS